MDKEHDESAAFGHGALSALSLEAQQVPLRHERAAVDQELNRISTFPMLQRRERFADLPVAMQQDLFTLHLERYIADHPDLPTEQLSVLYEGIGLLVSGRLEIDRKSAAWDRDVKPLLDAFTARARQVLPPNVIHEAILTLGTPEEVTLALPKDGRFRVRPNTPDCECSTESDWCGSFCPTCPLVQCKASAWPITCIPTYSGCGTWWQYGCNGMCATYP